MSELNMNQDENMAVTTEDISLFATTTAVALYQNRRRLLYSGILLTLGVFGNFLALLILSRKKANKNSKYTLMLRCLATNNLIGLLGMLSTLLLTIYLPADIFQKYVKFDCIGKVVWRFFGLSSGCIAAVMAIERWMALARPFIYYKHITYELVRKSINILILIAIVITFLPLFGFGAYIDESNPGDIKCLRYRNAEGFWNKAYAVLFMVFGVLLCIVIVACNLFVARVLWYIGRNREHKRRMNYNMVNREEGTSTTAQTDGESNSGSAMYNHQPLHHTRSMKPNTSPDELKFAKLMAVLSTFFVICWMPQMIAIPLAIKPDPVPKNHLFFVIADILMALHFTLDPYIYVLSRTKHSFVLGIINSLRCGLRRSQSDQSRYKATTVTEITNPNEI